LIVNSAKISKYRAQTCSWNQTVLGN